MSEINRIWPLNYAIKHKKCAIWARDFVFNRKNNKTDLHYTIKRNDDIVILFINIDEYGRGIWISVNIHMFVGIGRDLSLHISGYL